MKKILTLTLLAFSLVSTAQIEVFPTANASWHNLYGERRTGGPIRTLTHHFVNGDSLVNGTIYHKLYKFGKDSVVKFDRLYRIDGEKVIAQDDQGVDQVHYDFSLEVGDTFRSVQGRLFTVQSLDSIELLDGYHKVIDFGEARIIRGVGSVQGLFTFMGPNISDFWEELLCFSYESKSMYPYSSDSSCFDLTKWVGVKEVKYVGIKVYPNPSNSELNIPDATPNDKCSIYNVQGELVKEYLGHSKISVTDYKEGVYYLSLERDDVVFYSKFLVMR